MKNRRGLSTVVGMVFSIIALTTTVAYVSYSMNTLGQFNMSVITKNQQTIDTGKEKFQISSVQVVNNKFNITLVNTGILPINITKIWVQNTTATDWTRSYVPVNNFVGPGATLKNIGQNIPLYYSSASPSYHFKLVTSRGNTQEFNLNSIGSQPLLVQFNAIPNQIPPSFTTTILMTVTNNMTGNNYFINVQPQMIGLPVYTGSGTTMVSLVSQQTTSYPVLGPGNTAIFKWVYKVSGLNADTVKLTAALNGNPYSYSDTITLMDPLNAGFSANSLTSQGITCCRTFDSLLVLHQESKDTPTYGGVAAYQMYEGSVDNSGNTITLKNENTPTQNKMNFITENDTVNQVDIPSGKWTLTMKYKSSSVPNSITNAPDMIYYFNTLSSNVPFDSTGCNGYTTTLGGTSGTTPLFNTTAQYERDGSGFFTFDGSKTQFIEIAKNNGGGCGLKGNDLNTKQSTTTGWFKVAPSQKPAVKAVILRMEANSPNPKQWYEISMDNNGAISFNFLIKTVPGQITCITTGHNYADGNWHFFSAIRQNGEQCVLDMDGGPTYSTLNGNQFSGGSPANQNDKFSMDTDMFIGKSPTTTQQASYPFTGSIDNIMHWNNQDYLTDGSVLLSGSNQVADLYNKNYGTSAHSIIATIYQADKSGNKHGIKNILNATTIALPFADSKGSSTFWQNFTYTTPVLTNSSDNFGSWHFIPNARLLLNVTWAGSATQHAEALPMSWRIDDPGTGDQYDSSLTVPQPNVPFPSYFTFSSGNSVVVFTVSNSGPNGLWISMTGTRLVCQTMTPGGNSYAAIIQLVNATTLAPDADSLFIPLNNKVLLTFNQLSTVPMQNLGHSQLKGNAIVAGHYRMYAAILGYDDSGAQITKNFYIGVVNVT